MSIDPVTRHEFSMLVSQVEDNKRTIERIDTTGTRGVGVLSAQIAEVIRDVGKLQTDFTDHTKAHVNSRRFTITTIIAAIAAFATVIGFLVEIAIQVH